RRLLELTLAAPAGSSRSSSEPEAEDTAFPCCNAFTHLSCLVRCAQLHGTCPNCRAAIDHLPREPGIAARCQALGINMHAANISAPDTAVAVVRDYAMRTFSRADAVEPREPIHIRAACCNRLAGPALDFAELPDTRMHWTPLPRRGTEGIEAWLPQWMCMRCQNELRLERICVPDPTPSCPVCLTPMLWEVDCARRQERWACSRCPFAHSGRPLALRPVPPCRSPDLPTHAPPALPAADPGVHNALHAPVPAPTQFTTLGPPALPLRDGTNSALYVPLLLDAAGMLSAEAQRDWRSRAPINEWWDAAVQALRARAFIPVHELSAAVEHVAQAFAPPVLHSPSVMRFRAWAAAQAGNVTSLAELVRVIAVAPEGHYIAAPLQEALLTLLVGPAAVATLARLIEGLRARPVDEPPQSASAHAAAPAAMRWQGDGPVDDAAAPAAVRQQGDAAFRAGLQSLDAIDLAATLCRRVLTLQTVPVQVRSTLRIAFRAGLQLIADASSADSELRGWKLFYLATRMLLHRAPGETRVPATELDRRCELFRRGDWPCLLA
ncbi:NSF, partial [Symbiodinium necroappetens]